MDHFCMKQRFRYTLLGVWSYKGIDINSDHKLVIAKLELKLKIKLNENTKTIRKFSIEKLKNIGTLSKLKKELRKNLLASSQTPNIEKECENIRQAFINNATETIEYLS